MNSRSPDRNGDNRRSGGRDEDNSRNMANIECFFCKKRGHMKRECRKFKDFLRRNREDLQRLNSRRDTDENLNAIETDDTEGEDEDDSFSEISSEDERLGEALYKLCLEEDPNY